MAARFRRRDHPTFGQHVRPGHILVAIASNEAVEQKAGAHRDLSAQPRSVERKHEREWPNEMGGNVRESPALADGFTRSPDVEALQIPQAAVNRPEMVEGAAAAEIVTLGECHDEAALGRVAGD